MARRKKRVSESTTIEEFREAAKRTQPENLAELYRNEGFDPNQGRFLAQEEAATARLMGFYRQARAEIMTFTGGRGDPTPNDAAYYAQLTAEVDRVTDELGAGAQEWIDGTIPTAFVEGARTQDPRVGFTVVHDEALNALSQNTLGLIVNTNEGIRRSVQQTVASGILEGLSSAEMFKRMADGGLQPGPWKTVEERAGVIARTETMRAYNSGNIVGAQSSGAPFVEWIAADDEKTCEICGPRDGVRYRTPGFDPSRLGVTGEAPPPAPAPVKLTIPEDAGDPALVAQGQAELDRLQAAFPGITAPGLSIVDGGIGGVTSEAGDIFLRSGTFDQARWDQFEIDDAARKAHPDNDGLGYYAAPGVAGVVSHEFGHKVYAELGKSVDPEVKTFLDSMMKDLKKNPISIYGETGAKKGMLAGHEPFAEVFSAAMAGDDRYGLLPMLANKGYMNRDAIPAPRPPIDEGLQQLARTAGVRPFSAEAIRTLNEVETDIVRNADFETLVLVDPETGKVRGRVKGEALQVEITPELEAAMPGAILTHNHPFGHSMDRGSPQWAGSSFSSNDVLSFLDGKLNAVRAIGPGWAHTLSTPDGRKLPKADSTLLRPGETFDIFKDQPTPRGLHRTINEEVRDEFSRKVAAGELTYQQANADHYHEVTTRFTARMKEYGVDLTYTRELVPEAWDTTPREVARRPGTWPGTSEPGFAETPKPTLDFDDREKAHEYGVKTWGDTDVDYERRSGIYAGMDQGEIESLSRYSQSEYTLINGFLRKTVEAESLSAEAAGSSARQHVPNLDRAVKRLPVPEDLIVTRTTRELPFGVARDQAETLVGRSYTDPGFYSTTIGPPTSGWASYPVHYRIRVPRGTPAAYIAPVSGSADEHELLLDRGLEFRIAGTRTKYVPSPTDPWDIAITEVDLEVVPGSGANAKKVVAEEVPVGSKSAAGPKLSPKAAAALTPRRYTDNLRDQTIDAMDDTEEGKLLGDTLLKFQQTGSISRLRTAISNYISGKAQDATANSRAAGILGAIASYPEDQVPVELHRGTVTKRTMDDLLAHYTPGKKFDLNLTSFTSDRKIALDFAGRQGSRSPSGFPLASAHGPNERSVVVRLAGRKKALPIQNTSKSFFFHKEKEWTTAGGFVVDSVKQTAAGLDVTIRQERLP